jgi:hypothetical protein
MKPGERKKPYVLGESSEAVLRAVHFYRYMTALDVTHLLYSPRSITRVRSLLAKMCGGEDFLGGEYLYRFRVPNVTGGNAERIYILGSRGREFLESEGLSVSWYHRPEVAKRLSFTQVTHNLGVTRFLVAAHSWAKTDPGLSLAEARICYELAGVSVEVEEKGRREKVSVVPDGWLLFKRFVKGKVPVECPILVEIDRGTMYRERFKKHILSRVEFVRSGGYKRMFGREAVLIAYATTGATGEAQEGRRKTLCQWTREALKDAGRESWTRQFRFHSMSLGEVYKRPPFEGKVWYQPDREESPVGLFGG